MSFLYPTGIATGYSGVAYVLASQIGTVTGSSGITAPPAPSTTDGFLQALADVFLGAFGTQLEENVTLGVAGATSPAFADVPGSSISFNAPMAKRYSVDCDFSFFQSGGTPNVHSVRLVVNGDAGPAIYCGFASTFVLASFHLMHSAICAAGNNTIKLQWEPVSGTNINTNGSSYANFLVRG